MGKLAGQTYRTWDNGAWFSDDWGQRVNWSNNNSPSSIWEVARFTGNNASTTSIDINRNLRTGGVLFDAALTVDITFTRINRELSIRSGGASYGLINNSSRTITFENQMGIERDMTWSTTNVAGGDLIFENQVDTDGNNLTFHAANLINNIYVSGDIQDTGDIIKTGDGSLFLSGASTYTGNTEISDGTVIVSNDAGLGSVASNYTRVDNGGQLQLANVNIGSESLRLSGTGDGTGALRASTGANTVGGSVDLEANAEIQIDSSTSLRISGDITGLGHTLTVESIGKTAFDGTNTFDTLDKTGSGLLLVTGTNTYATANVNAGTFALGNSNILADTMDVNLGPSGTFAVGKYTETIDDLNGSGTLTIASGGSLTIDKIGNAGAFTGDLDIDGIMTLNGGLIGSGASGSSSSGTMVLNAKSTLEIAADFSFGGTLELTDNTTLILSGAGTQFKLDTLHITGDSIIDFTGVDATTFYIGNLVIDPGVAVSAIGWDSFYDLWTAVNFSGATLDSSNSTTAQITFNGFNPADTIWMTYNYGANEITVPEPGSYGALLMGYALTSFLLRRRRSTIVVS